MSSPYLTFRPVKVEGYALAEQFKRDTAFANTGSHVLFKRAFPPERPYRSHIELLQCVGPDSAVFACLGEEVIGLVELGTRRKEPQ